MKRLLIGLVVVLGLVVWAYFLLRPVNEVISEWRVVSNPSVYTQLPYVRWNDVTEGRLIRSIEFWDRWGRVPRLGEGAVPPPSYITKKLAPWGEEFIGSFVLPDDLGMPKYESETARPYVDVAWYRTKIEDGQYVVLVQRWASGEGERWVSLILPRQGIEEVWEGRWSKFLAPTGWIDGAEHCQQELLAVSEYCQYYLTRAAEYDTMLTSWLRDGAPPEGGDRYPWLVQIIRGQQ